MSCRKNSCFMMKRKRRRAFGIIECLILILVATVVIAALMESGIWADKMQATGRVNLGTYTLAASWFSALESIPPNVIDASFDQASRQAVALLGGDGVNFSGHQLSGKLLSKQNGAYAVALTVSSPGTELSPVVITRHINVYSPDTVSDDRVVP